MKRLISLFISVLIVMSTQVYAFEDVPDDASYLEDIESAVEAGIVNGVGDERFAPDEYVTVSQFVLMLNRTFGFSDNIGVDDVLTVENACYLLDECLAQYRKGREGSISTGSIKTMLSWHYRLFREAERQNVIESFINTGRNMIFGLYKKKRYVEKKRGG